MLGGLLLLHRNLRLHLILGLGLGLMGVVVNLGVVDGRKMVELGEGLDLGLEPFDGGLAFLVAWCLPSVLR